VDTGYVDAKLLVESQKDYQIDLVGPTRRNHQWQARDPKGFDADHFLIDWEEQQATCPEGHISSSWTPAKDLRKNEVIKIKFSMTDCQVCPSRSLCTQSIRHTRRTVTIRPHKQCLALKQRRKPRRDQGIEASLRSEGGDSWHHLARRSRHGFASFPLHRAGENASATRRHGCCSQSGPQSGIRATHRLKT
jgi:hypothetical protein